MAFKWEEPMNPFADVDFTNATSEGIRKTNETLDKLRDDFRNWNPTLMTLADDEHINRAVLNYSYNGAWSDFYAILLHNGYRVTAEVISDDEIEVTWRDK